MKSNKNGSEYRPQSHVCGTPSPMSDRERGCESAQLDYRPPEFAGSQMHILESVQSQMEGVVVSPAHTFDKVHVVRSEPRSRKPDSL